MIDDLKAMLKNAKMNLTHTEIMNIFAHSKMTIVDEEKDSKNNKGDVD